LIQSGDGPVRPGAAQGVMTAATGVEESLENKAPDGSVRLLSVQDGESGEARAEGPAGPFTTLVVAGRLAGDDGPAASGSMSPPAAGFTARLTSEAPRLVRTGGATSARSQPNPTARTRQLDDPTALRRIPIGPFSLLHDTSHPTWARGNGLDCRFPRIRSWTRIPRARSARKRRHALPESSGMRSHGPWVDRRQHRSAIRAKAVP